MDGLFNLLSVTQAAKLLGIPRQYVYNLIKDKQLTEIKVAGYVTVPRSEVERIKAEREAEK